MSFYYASYFEYMAKVFFHKLPTVLCKTVGVYQIGFQNRVTGRRQMDQASNRKTNRRSILIDCVIHLNGMMRSDVRLIIYIFVSRLLPMGFNVLGY